MLTDAQMQTLATGLRASTDPAVVAALAIRNDVALTEWCNATASPAVKAWRPAVQPVEIDEATNWTAFDGLSAGKRDSWKLFLAFARAFTRNKVRSWVKDVWGNVTAGSNSEALLLAGTENATNAQVIFGGSTATEGTVTATKRTFEAQVGLTELSISLNRF